MSGKEGEHSLISRVFLGRDSEESRIRSIVSVTEGGGIAGFGTSMLAKESDISYVLAFSVFAALGIFQWTQSGKRAVEEEQANEANKLQQSERMVEYFK